MSVMTVIADEISKQIDENAIKDLIIKSFVEKNSKFASSVNSIAYVETKKLFDNEFFANVFTNAIKSGSIDAQIKDKVVDKLKTICANNTKRLTAISKIREHIMSAFIQLSTKDYKESGFWNEMRSIIKPLVKDLVQDDIDKICQYINSDDNQMNFDISINSIDFEKSLNKTKINDSIKEFFSRLTEVDNIEISIRDLHSKDILECIQNAYNKANGNTTQKKDEFEDEFDEDDNALEAKVGRIRHDIRIGLAKSFIDNIGSKESHPKRFNYINAVITNSVIIENIKNEMVHALNDSIKSVSDQIIDIISAKISECINDIVKKYCSQITNEINSILISLCTTNNIKWNSHMLSLVNEPIMNTIIGNVETIINSLTRLIIRNINTKECKEMIKNNLINFNCDNGNIPNIIKNYISSSIINCNEFIAKIINAEAMVIKKMYNEAYKNTSYSALCNLCNNGVLYEMDKDIEELEI